MSETLTMVLVFVVGILLGAMFFGGLWWTVQKVIFSRWSALWVIGSLLLRTGIVLTGFYFVARGHWERLLLCLLGFITARLLVTWLTRSSGKNQIRPAKEASHAH